MIFLLLVFCIIKIVFALIWHKSEKSDIVKRKLRSWTKEKNVNCMHWKDFEILIAKNAYLTTELIQHIHEVSLENGLQDSIIKDNHLLKKGLSKNSEILLDFILLAKNTLFTAVKLIYANTLWLQKQVLVCVMTIFYYHLQEWLDSIL